MKNVFLILVGVVLVESDKDAVKAVASGLIAVGLSGLVNAPREVNTTGGSD